MIKQRVYCLSIILLFVFVAQAQQAEQTPFATLEKAVKEQRGGWAGDKSRLSTVFVAERKRLGDRFESELLKWLGINPEKHYWISAFLESESYLHGSSRLPHLSLLVKQQGLVLVQGKDDTESRGYVVGFSTTVAVISDQLGFAALASSYKNEAESLLVRYPELSAFVPAMTEAEWQRYDGIKSPVSRKVATLVGDSNPQPAAKLAGGVLNRRALNLIKPDYPDAARKANASGTVEVRVVFDEPEK